MTGKSPGPVGLLLVLLPLLALQAWTAPPPPREDEILARVGKALASTYYQGLLITTRRLGAAKEDEVAKAYFGPGGRQSLEIIAPGWRSGELLVVDGTTSWVYYPDCGAVLSLPVKDPAYRLAIGRKARLVGNERLHERPTLVFLWENERGQRRIWIDAEKYVPLKREDRNQRGEMIFQQTLEEAAFPAEPPLSHLQFTPEPGTAVYTDEKSFQQAASIPHVQRGVDFRIRVPSYLPAGSSFDRAYLRRLPQIDAVQLRYLTGKGTAFSLFEYRAIEAPLPPEKPFLAIAGSGRRGSLNFLRWRWGEIECILVSALPISELREIAKSAR